MDFFSYCGIVISGWLAVECCRYAWHYYLHRELPLTQKDLLIVRLEDALEFKKEEYRFKEEFLNRALEIETDKARRIQQEKDEMLQSVISKI